MGRVEAGDDLNPDAMPRILRYAARLEMAAWGVLVLGIGALLLVAAYFPSFVAPSPRGTVAAAISTKVLLASLAAIAVALSAMLVVVLTAALPSADHDPLLITGEAMLIVNIVMFVLSGGRGPNSLTSDSNLSNPEPVRRSALWRMPVITCAVLVSIAVFYFVSPGIEGLWGKPSPAWQADLAAARPWLALTAAVIVALLLWSRSYVRFLQRQLAPLIVAAASTATRADASGDRRP